MMRCNFVCSSFDINGCPLQVYVENWSLGKLLSKSRLCPSSPVAPSPRVLYPVIPRPLLPPSPCDHLGRLQGVPMIPILFDLLTHRLVSMVYFFIVCVMWTMLRSFHLLLQKLVLSTEIGYVSLMGSWFSLDVANVMCRLLENLRPWWPRSFLRYPRNALL